MTRFIVSIIVLSLFCHALYCYWSLLTECHGQWLMIRLFLLTFASGGIFALELVKVLEVLVPYLKELKEKAENKQRQRQKSKH